MVDIRTISLITVTIAAWAINTTSPAAIIIPDRITAITNSRASATLAAVSEPLVSDRVAGRRVPRAALGDKAREPGPKPVDPRV